MKELLIYHIIDENLEDVVANFCNTLYQQGIKSMLYFQSTELMQNCDKKIWTFSSEKFIPHSTILDNLPIEMQNFYLTNKMEFYPQFTSFCFIYDFDDIENQIQQILSTELPNHITKIAYIFSGIVESEIYLQAIKSDEVKNKFSSCKFFKRSNKSWLKVCEL